MGKNIDAIINAYQGSPLDQTLSYYTQPVRDERIAAQAKADHALNYFQSDPSNQALTDMSVDVIPAAVGLTNAAGAGVRGLGGLIDNSINAATDTGRREALKQGGAGLAGIGLATSGLGVIVPKVATAAASKGAPVSLAGLAGMKSQGSTLAKTMNRIDLSQAASIPSSTVAELAKFGKSADAIKYNAVMQKRKDILGKGLTDDEFSKLPNIPNDPKDLVQVISSYKKGMNSPNASATDLDRNRYMIETSQKELDTILEQYGHIGGVDDISAAMLKDVPVAAELKTIKRDINKGMPRGDVTKEMRDAAIKSKKPVLSVEEIATEVPRNKLKLVNEQKALESLGTREQYIAAARSEYRGKKFSKGREDIAGAKFDKLQRKAAEVVAHRKAKLEGLTSQLDALSKGVTY